jgi:Flp pilus assembly protein TadD
VRRPSRPRKRPLRRPLGLAPAPEEARGAAEGRIEEALLAADDGQLESAASIVSALLAEDPLLADAHFVRGLVQLETGDARAATATLRRCLYLDPSFGLAAFELGRAYDACGDSRAARRAYGQALRSLDPDDDRHRAILDQVDLADVAAACAARLRAEGSVGR